MKKLLLTLCAMTPFAVSAQTHIPITAASVDSSSSTIGPISLANMNDGDPTTGTYKIQGEGIYYFASPVCVDSITFHSLKDSNGIKLLTDPGSGINTLPTPTGNVVTSNHEVWPDGGTDDVETAEYSVDVAAVVPAGTPLVGIVVANVDYITDFFGIGGPDCAPDVTPTVPTSQLQSTAAINTYRFTREHIAARLDATQQQTGTYLQQFAGDARDGSGARWTTLNISQISGNGADGIFAAGTAAWDLSEGDNSLIGALVGAEYGSYDVGADSVEKLGVSGGVYGGVKLGGSALLEGHLTYTYFQNEIASAGASVTVPSQRLLAHVSLSAGLGEAGGLAINPYLEADYAQESIDGYNLGGTAVSSATVTTGLASLGVEITTPWNVDRGQFYGKLQADQAFGNDPAQTNEDVTGTVGLGWFSNTSYDSIGRIEINASGLGGDGIQETRLEGHWERNF